MARVPKSLKCPLSFIALRTRKVANSCFSSGFLTMSCTSRNSSRASGGGNGGRFGTFFSLKSESWYSNKNTADLRGSHMRGAYLPRVPALSSEINDCHIKARYPVRCCPPPRSWCTSWEGFCALPQILHCIPKHLDKFTVLVFYCFRHRGQGMVHRWIAPSARLVKLVIQHSSVWPPPCWIQRIFYCFSINIMRSNPLLISIPVFNAIWTKENPFCQSICVIIIVMRKYWKYQ